MKAVQIDNYCDDVEIKLREGEPRFQSRHLEQLFHACFYSQYSTLLVGGAAEPLYTPAQAGSPAYIHYTRDYFRSALHEVAHWCVAGEHRRTLEDYGYWYAPEGRTLEQQALFEQVEIRPQAIELLFCAAVGHGFYVSCDNFADNSSDEAFANNVWQEAMRMLAEGGPPRAAQWLAQLHTAYQRPAVSVQQVREVWRHTY